MKKNIYVIYRLYYCVDWAVFISDIWLLETIVMQYIRKKICVILSGFWFLVISTLEIFVTACHIISFIYNISSRLTSHAEAHPVSILHTSNRTRITLPARNQEWNALLHQTQIKFPTFKEPDPVSISAKSSICNDVITSQDIICLSNYCTFVST